MDPKIGTQIGRNWKDSFKDKEGHHHLLRYSLQGKHCYNLKPVCIKLAQPWLVTFPGQLFFSGKKAQPGPTSVRALPKMQARCIYARYTWPLGISDRKKQIPFKILYILVKQGIVRVIRSPMANLSEKRRMPKKLPNWVKRFVDNIEMEKKRHQPSPW